MPINGPEVAKRIKDTVTALGMSMGDFYKKSGISSALLSQWNTGTQNPTPPKLAAAAKALEKTIEYVAFGEEGIKNPAPSGNGKIDELLQLAGELTPEQFERLLAYGQGMKDAEI